MSDEFMGEMNELAESARRAAADLEAEGRAINAALKQADDLCAFIIDRAMSEREGENVLIGFNSMDAAAIANMALAYQTARAGESASNAPAHVSPQAVSENGNVQGGRD
jgi:hypothetical protein